MRSASAARSPSIPASAPHRLALTPLGVSPAKRVKSDSDSATAMNCVIIADAIAGRRNRGGPLNLRDAARRLLRTRPPPRASFLDYVRHVQRDGR